MAPEEERNNDALNDDAALEKMQHYSRLKSDDELLRYIKTYGMRRHG
jgi:hypothetical protein